jgi:hypothetical protein
VTNGEVDRKRRARFFGRAFFIPLRVDNLLLKPSDNVDSKQVKGLEENNLKRRRRGCTKCSLVNVNSAGRETI